MALNYVRKSLKSALFASAVAALSVSFISVELGQNVAYAQDEGRQFSAATGEIVNAAQDLSESKLCVYLSTPSKGLSETPRARGLPDRHIYNNNNIAGIPKPAVIKKKAKLPTASYNIPENPAAILLNNAQADVISAYWVAA